MATITMPITITVEDSDLQKELSAIGEALNNVDLSVSLGSDRKWRRLVKAWLNFIDDCERIQHGVLSQIHLEHGIPVWGVIVSEDGQGLVMGYYVTSSIEASSNLRIP